MHQGLSINMAQCETKRFQVEKLTSRKFHGNQILNNAIYGREAFCVKRKVSWRTKETFIPIYELFDLTCDCVDVRKKNRNVIWRIYILNRVCVWS